VKNVNTIVRRSLISPFLLLIYLYKWIISPIMPGACRHYPTCSQYSIDALKYHGIFRGSYLATHRILRCNPWGTSGYDPVPRFIIKKIRVSKLYGITKDQVPASDLLTDKPFDS
jgi:hypothetical protein